MDKNPDLNEKLNISASFIREQLGDGLEPDIFIVLGSGFSGFANNLENKIIIDLSDIPYIKVPKVSGHGRSLEIGNIGPITVSVLTGRLHLYEGHTAHDVVYPIKVMARLGIKKVLLTNAAGSLNKDLSPGEAVVITDHINLNGKNCLVGPASTIGQQFVDMVNCYDLEWQKKIIEQTGLKKGIYASVLGPTYETPAESRMLAVLGADMVGMSTVQETIAARAHDMKVAGISFITNYAGGLNVNHKEVLQMGKQKAKDLENILQKIVEILA